MSLLTLIKDNVPSILTGIAIFGAAFTAVEAVKATPKAIKILEEEEIDVKTQPKEAVKACWKCYIFPMGILTGTIASILGVNFLPDPDKAKLIAALAYSEHKGSAYRKAAKETFGEQAEAIDAAVVDNKLNNSDVPKEVPKKGYMWCYEPESEQWFQTSIEEILWVELTANKMFHNQGELTFNQFLSLFKNAKKVNFGDHFGWYIYDENGVWDFNWSFYKGGTPWIDIQPVIDQKRDCLVLAYGMHPGDDLDCHDRDVEEPEQFVVR